MTEPINLWAARREKLAKAHLNALTALIEHMGLPLARMEHELVVNGERLRVTITLEKAAETSRDGRSV